MSRVSALSPRALAEGVEERLRGDLRAGHQFGASHRVAGFLQNQARGVPLANFIGRCRGGLGIDAEFLQGRAGERDGGFEHFADLEIHVPFQERDGADSVIGAHETPGIGEVLVNDLDDLDGGFGFSVQTQIISAFSAPAARRTSRRVPSP